MLEQQAAAILPATVLKGHGGMGKSTLARHYVETFMGHYFGIYWLNAQDRTQVIAGLCALARQLSDNVPFEDSENLAQHAVALLQRTGGPWLLVYDNAETLQELSGLLPQRPNIHVMLTSREGGWPDWFAEHPTDKLSVPDAVALLLQESARSGDRAGAEALTQVLGCLPLALVQAGRWLRDTRGDFADYADRHAELLSTKPVSIADYPDSIYGAVKLSLDKLSDDAALLMKVFAWLSPDHLRPDLVTALAEKDPEDERFEFVPPSLWELSRQPDRVQQAFTALNQASLISVGDQGYNMHRLTQQAQRALLPVAPVGFANVAVPFEGTQDKAPGDAVPGNDPGPLTDETTGPGSSPEQIFNAAKAGQQLPQQLLQRGIQVLRANLALGQPAPA